MLIKKLLLLGLLTTALMGRVQAQNIITEPVRSGYLIYPKDYAIETEKTYLDSIYSVISNNDICEGAFQALKDTCYGNIKTVIIEDKSAAPAGVTQDSTSAEITINTAHSSNAIVAHLAANLLQNAAIMAFDKGLTELDTVISDTLKQEYRDYIKASSIIGGLVVANTDDFLVAGALLGTFLDQDSTLSNILMTSEGIKFYSKDTEDYETELITALVYQPITNAITNQKSSMHTTYRYAVAAFVGNSHTQKTPDFSMHTNLHQYIREPISQFIPLLELPNPMNTLIKLGKGGPNSLNIAERSVLRLTGFSKKKGEPLQAPGGLGIVNFDNLSSVEAYFRQFKKYEGDEKPFYIYKPEPKKKEPLEMFATVRN